jgi:hypothetical protein
MASYCSIKPNALRRIELKTGGQKPSRRPVDNASVHPPTIRPIRLLAIPLSLVLSPFHQRLTECLRIQTIFGAEFRAYDVENS